MSKLHDAGTLILQLVDASENEGSISEAEALHELAMACFNADKVVNQRPSVKTWIGTPHKLIN